ncbi:MAG: GGDEF domain-containing protein [Synergistales bacterium]|nr:GGDEF domain-containing protein [Synergistales bacterium]
MQSPAWARYRLRDRWSSLLLEHGFEEGVSPCLGALRHTGGAEQALLLGAPDDDSPEWRVIAARVRETEEEIMKRLTPVLQRLPERRSLPVAVEPAGGPQVLVPVRNGAGLLGALGLWKLWGRSISREDYPYLMDLAKLLGRSWRESRERLMLHRALQLASAGTIANQALYGDAELFPAAIRKALEQVNKLVPFSFCSLYGLDWDTRNAEPLFTWRERQPFDLYEDEEFLLGKGLKALALEQGKAIVLNGLDRGDLGCYAALPAVARDETSRVVGTFGGTDSGLFTTQRLRWLRTFMDRFVQTWYLWMQFRRLEREALRDEITGINNKRHGERVARRMWERHTALGGALSVAIFDLDHFKKVNDLHGHLAGDIVLGRFGEMLQEQEGDLVVPYRFGGEEFCLLMEGVSMKQAVLTCETVRRTIAEETFRTQYDVLKVTVSCGITEAVTDGLSSLQEAFDKADRRLYQAKHRGRNRVVFTE